MSASTASVVKHSHVGAPVTRPTNGPLDGTTSVYSIPHAHQIIYNDYASAPPPYDPFAHEPAPQVHEDRPESPGCVANQVHSVGPRFSVRHRGTSNASVEVHLSKGQSVKAESDALYAMQGDISVGSTLTGGLWGMLKRWITSESTFHQTLTARSGEDNMVMLAPDVLGDVEVRCLGRGESICLTKGAFLACDDSVNLDVAHQSFSQSFFSGAGIWVITATGPGNVVFNSYGGIDTLECTPDRQVTVDNGHMVAWDSSLKYSIQTASDTYWGSLTSGEGLVCKFSGNGKVYVQTRKPPPPVSPQCNCKSSGCGSGRNNSK